MLQAAVFGFVALVLVDAAMEWSVRYRRQRQREAHQQLMREVRRRANEQDVDRRLSETGEHL